MPKTKSASYGDVDVAILCGGLGTRLQAVVPDRPKPMADMGGVPFLERLLRYLSRQGFSRAILCIGHKADIIERHFLGAELFPSFVFSRESRPLGTGGALRHALRYLRSEQTLVLNGDSFCPVDFRRLLRFHTSRMARVTMGVARTATGNDFGHVAVARDGTVRCFSEKSKISSGWVNAGVYVFERGMIRCISRKAPLSLEHDVFPNLAGHGLYAYRLTGPLVDIGTPARYKRAQRILARLLP